MGDAEAEVTAGGAAASGPGEDFRSHRHLIRSVVITKSSTESETDDGNKVVNQYVLHEELGRGAYGIVLRCEYLNDPAQKFAVKVVSRSVLKRKREFVKGGVGKPKVTNAFDDVVREIAVMKKLRQNNIVRLFEVIDDDANDQMYLVMELVKGGQVATWNMSSLSYRAHFRLCESESSFAMSELHARRMMHDVVNGLDYLHRQGVVHRDLKPENLLLTDDEITGEPICKICDFGVSQMCEELEMTEHHASPQKARLRNMKGTFHFQGPECLTGEEYDGFVADIWALGICLYAFLFEKLPWFADTPANLCDLITSKDLAFPGKADSMPGAKAFIATLLEKSAAKRPQNTQAIKALPWLAASYLSKQDALIHGGDDVGVNVSVNKHDISTALSKTAVDLATVTHIKSMVRNWRKRAMENRQMRETTGSDAGSSVDESGGNPNHVNLSNMVTGITSVTSVVSSNVEEMPLPLDSPPTTPLTVGGRMKIEAPASKAPVKVGAGTGCCSVS